MGKIWKNFQRKIKFVLVNKGKVMFGREVGWIFKLFKGLHSIFILLFYFSGYSNSGPKRQAVQGSLRQRSGHC